MLAQVTENGIELGGIFDKLKIDIDSYKDIISDFKKLDLMSDDFKLDDGKTNWDAIVESIEGCDDIALSYFKTLDDGNDTIDNQSASTRGLSAYLRKNGLMFDFATVKATLFNTALNAGIMLAVTIAIKILTQVLDNMTASLEDVENRIQNNKTALSDYTSKIEELTKKLEELDQTDVRYLSDDERKELKTEADYINSQIELYNQLAEAKEKAINDDYIKAAMGNNQEIAYKKIWEDFNNGDWDDLHSALYESSELKWYDFLGLGVIPHLLSSIDDGNYIAEADKLLNDYLKLQNKYASLQQIAINKGNNKALEQNIEDTQSQMHHTAAELAQYIEQIQTARDALYNSAYRDDYADVIAEMDEAIAHYQKALTDNVYASKYLGVNTGASAIFEPVIQQVNKLISILEFLRNYSFTEILDFEKMFLADKLNELRERFNNFKAVLSDKAFLDGLKTALSNSMPPELVENWEKFQNTIKTIHEYFNLLIQDIDSKTGLFNLLNGLREHLDGIWNTLSNIVDNFGWIFKDAIDAWKAAHDLDYSEQTEPELGSVSDKLKKFIVESNEALKSIDPKLSTPTLSVTDTIDQLNTRIKPALSSLKSEYQNIFTDGKFNSDNIDILSTCDTIKSKLDEMSDPEGLNLDIDYSAYEDFARILSDSESDAADVQGAFDKLATSIVQAGLSGIEDFETLKSALGDLSIANNEIIAFQELCQNTEALKEAGLDLKDTTEEQMEAFVRKTVSTENCSKALAYLKLCEISVNNARVETKEDVDRILSLAQAAGIGAEALNKLEYFKTALENETDPKARQWILQTINEYTKMLASDIEAVQIGVDPTITTSSAKDTTETFDWIQQAIEKVEKGIEKLDNTVNSSYSTFSQKNQALAQEIEKVNEEIGLQQKAYEEYMQKAESVGLSDNYKSLVRDGAINIENISNENLKTAISDYQEWYEKAQNVSDAISDLNEKIKDLHVSGYELKADRLEELLDSESVTEKQYLTEMEKLYKEYYENQVEYAQKAHEAKLSLLDKKKSYLNSVANAASSLLDKEINRIQDNAKAQESIYQEQIDLLNKKKKPLQDELDALEDKAKEEDLILDLQKKQYELKRAENQRDKFIYKDGQMIYANDEQSVKDAKKNVDDAQLELQKYEIQKQIDALDEEIDRYNSLIDAVNESADNQVDALEKIKNKWQEVIDRQEYAQNLILLTGEFGADAITRILTGSDDDLLTQWKNSYISTLADIDMESQGYISDMTNQIASLYGIDLSLLQNQFSGVKNSISGMTDALGEAVSAIGIGNTTNNTSDNQDMAEGESVQSSPTENSLKSAIENETATAIRSFDQHTEKLTNEVIPAIQSATAEMETFNETADMDIEKTVTINYVVNGDGNAYSEGTKGLTHDNGTVSPKPVNNTNDGTIITPDGIVLRPLQPEDKMYDLTQKWNTYMESIDYNIDKLAANSMQEHNKQMHEAVNQISNASVVNSRNVQPSINVGDININCPGITDTEVAKQVGVALDAKFRGFNNYVNQQIRIR